MKKLFVMLGIAAASVLMSSCSATYYTYKTATVRDVNSTVYTHTVADLDVSSQKISYTFYVGADFKYTGRDNIINAAVSAALEQNGNADVLVGLETTVKTKNGQVESVIVTGYPAKYVNFRSDPVQHTESCAIYGKRVVAPNPATGKKAASGVLAVYGN